MVPTTSALIPALIAHTPKASAGSRFAGLPPTSLIGTPGASLEGVGSSAGSSKPVPEIARFPPLPRWNRARPPPNIQLRVVLLAEHSGRLRRAGADIRQSLRERADLSVSRKPGAA